MGFYLGNHLELFFSNGGAVDSDCGVEAQVPVHWLRNLDITDIGNGAVLEFLRCKQDRDAFYIQKYWCMY